MAVVGYAKHASFVYVFCTGVDSIINVEVNDKVALTYEKDYYGQDKILINSYDEFKDFKKTKVGYTNITSYQEQVWTYMGEYSSTYPSNPDKPSQPLHISPNGFPDTISTAYKKLNYNGYCVLSACKLQNPNLAVNSYDPVNDPGEFVGDNTTTIPKITLTVRKTNFPDFLAAGQNLGITNSHITDGFGVNAIVIIWDLLVNHLQISTDDLDIESFMKAATTISSEGIFLNIPMTQVKSIKEWLKDIFKYIDGTLYRRPDSGKYYISLYRKDLIDIENLFTVENYMIKDVVISKQSDSDIYTKFVFTFLDPVTLKPVDFLKESYKLHASAPRTKTLKFTYLVADTNNSSNSAHGLLMTRNINKYSKPLFYLKFKINIFDAKKLYLGGLFKYNVVIGNTSKEMIFRIIKLSQNTENASVSVEAIEDLY